jgi:hypothetical protein
MGWVLRLAETGPDAASESIDLIEIHRSSGLANIANLGLTLSEAKELLARVQQAIVAAQVRDHAVRRPSCAFCSGQCHLKDWRLRRIATPFGEVAPRLRRWLCAECGRTETGIAWPENCRSTPELNVLQAHLSALLTYRVAAGVLAHLLPVETGTSPETLRGHAIKVADQLRDAATGPCVAKAPAIDISLDATFVRSRHEGERHMEVRVGNVEAPGGGRQVFGTVTKSGTSILALIGRNLEIMGRNGDTKLTAFTDGCSGLRSILTDAGVKDPPILDWYHIAMRLQHAKLSAGGLADETPGRAAAKDFIVAQVERLHWRIWNGKAKNAHVTIDRIRAVMDVFKNEARPRGASASPGKLWHALHEIDEYLTGQSAWLVNYAERYHAGLRVGTSITEGTANFLVNRRMNKRQQMRWSRRGADAVLQVRCAIYNGTLGTGFGRLFNPESEPTQQLAMAA